MELIDGVPLGDKLRRNGLPLQECLRIGIQIAAGLGAAHKAGVIHRDLKPGNIIVSSSGVVKIVDFGLAKLSQESFAEEETGSATKPRTAEGHVLGTVAYMSPEQAQGHPVDARSDVQLRHAVLRVADGTRPFRGDNAIRHSPRSCKTRQSPGEITVLRCRTRPTRLCCAAHKDPDRRFQTSADLRLALEDPEDSELVGPAVPTSNAVRSSRRWWWVAAAVAAIGVGTCRDSSSSPAVNAATGPAHAAVDVRDRRRVTPASPDGKLLVYASDRSGEGQLDIWLKQAPAASPFA
jgi:serine/threonine protein kinase